MRQRSHEETGQQVGPANAGIALPFQAVALGPAWLHSAFDAMRHWYLLARESFAPRPGAVVTDGSRLAFMAGGGPSPVHALSPADRRRIFWIGMVESTPLFGTSLIGASVDTGIVPGVWIVSGCILSAVCCWLLRHRTPPTVIHLAERTHGLDTGRES